MQRMGLAADRVTDVADVADGVGSGWITDVTDVADGVTDALYAETPSVTFATETAANGQPFLR